MAEPLCEGCPADFPGCCMFVESDPRDKRIAELESALGKIASCEKRCDGDVVDIAREALKK